MSLLLACFAISTWAAQVHDSALADLLAWRKASSPHEIWRYWTAAGLHWNGWHLSGNLIGCLALAAWGRACGLGLRSALAWWLAWPLTQAGLWFSSDLQTFGGLSGVLHAGVTIGAAHLLTRPQGQQRLLGIWVLLGLALKLVFELPGVTAWGGLQGPAAMAFTSAPGYTVAYQAHWAGCITGLACAGLLYVMRGDRRAGMGGDRRAVGPAHHPKVQAG